MGYDRSVLSTRHKIIDRFASWTAVSATPQSSLGREQICPALKAIDFHHVLCNGRPIDKQEFDQWHKEQVQTFREEVERSGRKCSAGQAAKIINVYLKTQCYLGGRGRSGLDEVIHPPIDRILIRELRKEYPKNALFRKFSLKGIEQYSRYQEIVDFLSEIAKQENCKLVEIDRHGSYCE